MNNSYLQLLPFEIQDYIFEIVKSECVKELNAELLHNIDNTKTLTHLEDHTLYRKLIDYIISINWRNIHLYVIKWIEKIINNGDNSMIYHQIDSWINNSQHNLCRYGTVLENSLYLLHDPETEIISDYGLRTRIMICLVPLSYQELLSLCKFIKKNRISIEYTDNSDLNNTI